MLRHRKRACSLQLWALVLLDVHLLMDEPAQRNITLPGLQVWHQQRDPDSYIYKRWQQWRPEVTTHLINIRFVGRKMIYQRDLLGKGKAQYLIKTSVARTVDCSETTELMVALWWGSDSFQHFLPLILLGMIYSDPVLKPPLTLDTFSVVQTTEPTRATLRRQESSNFNGYCASWCSSC